MKQMGKIAVCLVCGLVLNTATRADDGGLANNPYASIVARNVFSLNPPQPEAPPEQADPPPKITPNGIMSIFGQLQALFKVSIPAKGGQPAKEESYILSEGQRQDDIEVVQINEKDCIVTFNNHGTVQELPLNKAAVPPPNTIIAPPGRMVPGQIPTRFGGRFGGPGAARNRALANGSAAAAAPTPESSSSTTSASSQAAPMTATEEAVLIEANRLLTQKQVDEGTFPPLPVTSLTPPDATAHGGNPLIVTPGQ
jgi:hypothetical protein